MGALSLVKGRRVIGSGSVVVLVAGTVIGVGLLSAGQAYALPTGCVVTDPTVTCTYTAAGEYAFAVPYGVTSVQVTAIGAGGGTSDSGFDVGGRGAQVSGSVSTVGVSTLYAEVGGAGSDAGTGLGGFNGGGGAAPNSIHRPSAGGGGASDVRTTAGSDSDSLGSRVLVAAGGAGAGEGSFGGDAGSEGQGFKTNQGGQPGGSGAGGAGGASPGVTADPGDTLVQSAPGVLGVGGAGVHELLSSGVPDEYFGGGGGGGLYGGGGGGLDSGGGGGSSFVPAGGSGPTVTTDAASVTITYTPVPLPAPSAPSAPTISAGHGSVTVGWMASTSDPVLVSGYNVYCSSVNPPSTSAVPAAMTDANTTTATVTGLADAATYYCDVTTTGPGGESGPTDVVSATTDSVPSAPLNLSAVAGDGSITLSWQQPSSDGGTDLTAYGVYCDTVNPPTTLSGIVTPVASVLATSATVTQLTNLTTYYCAVTAANVVGNGPQSNVVTVVPKPGQTITFAPLTPITFGNPAPALHAISSAGLTITYSTAPGDPCSVSGSKLTVTGAGTCHITASQPGSSSVAAATPVEQDLVIAKAPTAVSKVSESVFGATFSATLKSSTAAPKGLAGAVITFTTGTGNNTVTICTATTDATGVATCAPSPSRLVLVSQALAANHNVYAATFAGDANYQPSQATGK